MLLEAVNIKQVYIGTLDPNKEAAGGLDRLKKAGIDVKISLLKEKTDQLLEPFILWQKKNFVFFKIAMREDGSVDGGYITSQESLNFVHQLRTKIDLMVIGGETVRVDRPTLDTRFANKNLPPDILIYSRKVHKIKDNGFDTDIKLFSVKGREVFIEDTLERVKEKNFVMYEGGYKLLEHLKDKFDYLVVFISHKKSSSKPFEVESLGFTKIYSYMINQYDELVFLK